VKRAGSITKSVVADIERPYLRKDRRVRRDHHRQRIDRASWGSPKRSGRSKPPWWTC